MTRGCEKLFGMARKVFPAPRVFALALLPACVPLPAAAQQVCASHAEIAEQLVQTWGEVVIGSGLANGNVIELWAGPNGSFTLLGITPSGRACVLGAGEGWEMLPAPVPGRPA